MTQLALFDDPRQRNTHAHCQRNTHAHCQRNTHAHCQRNTHAHCRCDGTCPVHALLPNMAYACYETILTVCGHFEMGTQNFDKVTCPGCRSEGVENIRLRMRRQQGQCVECGERLNKRDQCPSGCAQ